MSGAKGNPGHALNAGIVLAMDPGAAFDAFAGELEDALRDSGLTLEPGPGGRICEGEFEVGRVLSWERGRRIALRWMQASWNPGEITEVEIRFDEFGPGTRIAFEHGGWGRLLGDDAEAAGWFAARLVAPLMKATSPGGLGDWITDRRARRPSGPGAVSVYRDPLYHYPGFSAILAELSLKAGDRLLEVGCGGGVLLKLALESGCTAAGVDHSPAMVRLAREMNSESMRAGRLELLAGNAESLPFPDSSFTCATMSGVFGFIPRPVPALAELLRVLRREGRIVILGSDPSMRGTPAAPEPMASRLSFYDDRELEGLARRAGFNEVTVVRRDLEAYAREAGIPEEHMPLFKGPGTPFLVARKT